MYINPYEVTNKSTFGDWIDSIQGLNIIAEKSTGLTIGASCDTPVENSFGWFACILNNTVLNLQLELSPPWSGALPQIAAGVDEASTWVDQINGSWNYFYAATLFSPDAPAGELVTKFDLRTLTTPAVGELDAAQKAGTERVNIYGALWRDEVIQPNQLGTLTYAWYLQREGKTWCIESHGEPAVATLGAPITGEYSAGLFTTGLISPSINTQGKPYVIRMLYSGNSKHLINATGGPSTEYAPVYTCMFASVRRSDPYIKVPLSAGSHNFAQNKILTQGPFFREARSEGIPTELEDADANMFKATPYLASGIDQPFYLVRMGGYNPRVDLCKYADELSGDSYLDMATAVHIVFCFEADNTLCGVIIDGEMLGFEYMDITSGYVDTLGSFEGQRYSLPQVDRDIRAGVVGRGVPASTSVGMRNISLAVGSFSYPYYLPNKEIQSYEMYGLGGTVGAFELVGVAGAPMEEGSDMYLAGIIDEPQMEEAQEALLTEASQVCGMAHTSGTWLVMENQQARLKEDPTPDPKTKTNVLKRKATHGVVHKDVTTEVKAPTFSYNTSLGFAAEVNNTNTRKTIYPLLRNTIPTYGWNDSPYQVIALEEGTGLDVTNGIRREQVTGVLVGCDYLAFDIDSSQVHAEGTIIRISAGGRIEDPQEPSKYLDPSFEVVVIPNAGTPEGRPLNWRGVTADAYPYLHDVPFVTTYDDSGVEETVALSCRRRKRWSGDELSSYDPANDPIPREEYPGGHALLQIYTHLESGAATPVYSEDTGSHPTESWRLPQLHPYKTHRVEVYRYKDATNKQAYRFIVDGRVSEPLYALQSGSHVNAGVNVISEQPTNPALNLWLYNKLQVFDETTSTGVVVSNITYGTASVDNADTLQSVTPLGKYNVMDMVDKRVKNSVSGMKPLVSNFPEATTSMWAAARLTKYAMYGEVKVKDPRRGLMHQYKFGPSTPSTTRYVPPTDNWWYTKDSTNPGIAIYKGLAEYKIQRNMKSKMGAVSRWVLTGEDTCELQEVAAYELTKQWPVGSIPPEFLTWAGFNGCYLVVAKPSMTFSYPANTIGQFDVVVMFDRPVTPLSGAGVNMTNAALVEVKMLTTSTYRVRAYATSTSNISLFIKANAVRDLEEAQANAQSETLHIVKRTGGRPKITFSTNTPGWISPEHEFVLYIESDQPLADPLLTSYIIGNGWTTPSGAPNGGNPVPVPGTKLRWTLDVQVYDDWTAYLWMRANTVVDASTGLGNIEVETVYVKHYPAEAPVARLGIGSSGGSQQCGKYYLTIKWVGTNEIPTLVDGFTIDDIQLSTNHASLGALVYVDSEETYRVPVYTNGHTVTVTIPANCVTNRRCGTPNGTEMWLKTIC